MREPACAPRGPPAEAQPVVASQRAQSDDARQSVLNMSVSLDLEVDAETERNSTSSMPPRNITRVSPVKNARRVM